MNHPIHDDHRVPKTNAVKCPLCDTFIPHLKYTHLLSRQGTVSLDRTASRLHFSDGPETYDDTFSCPACHRTLLISEEDVLPFFQHITRREVKQPC